LPAVVKYALREALLGMGDDQEGARILAGWGIARFAVVADETYDPIRLMAAAARDVQLAQST